MTIGRIIARFRDSLRGSEPKHRLLVVCGLGVIALAASAASAAAIIWQTGGKKLEVAESFKVTVEKQAGYANFVIKTAGVTITCTKQTTIGGNIFEIKGGEPGEANGALELTGCAVTAPAKCEVQGTKQKIPGSLGSLGTSDTLVKNAAGTEVLLLFGLSDEIEFINKGGVCPIAGQTKLTGEVLGELKPQKKEETEIKLVFPVALIANYTVKVGGCVIQKQPTAPKLNGEAVTQFSGETGIFESVVGPPRAFGVF